MKKRIIKKLAKKGIEELKQMSSLKPISTRKRQIALASYLQREYPKRTARETKLYREFWEVFNALRS